MISHGKIFVNKKIVKTRSYLIKQGDIISIDSNEYINIEINILKSSVWPIPPKYLLINYKIMQIIMGDIKGINLSHNYRFNLNIEKVIENF